jgi:NAD(P)H-dependent flavin oxidoreductase YrpB (nitropropane dioxygenase family)
MQPSAGARETALQNRFTRDYGIEHPIVQATLGVVSMPALVAAVCEAGGMGTLGAVGWPLMSAAELRGLLQAVRGLTERPFGVAFDTEFATEDHLRACIDLRVCVVSFDTSDPPPHYIRRLRGSSVRVWVKAGTVAEARSAARAGADAIIAHGREAAGGCRSHTGMFTLLPAMVDAVWPVPVLASGGIADGRGLAAALALGADAAWIGTRFLASREANAHGDYKRRVVEAGEGDTVVNTVFSPSGRAATVRMLRTRPAADVQPSEPAANGTDEHRLIGQTELGGRAIEIREYSCMMPTPETVGDIEAMCMPAGQSATLVRGVRPAREIVREMVREAESILLRREWETSA